MLRGAIAELAVGDNADLATDVGPIIDGAALKALEEHAGQMARLGQLLATAPMDPALPDQGNFFAPRAFLLDSIEPLTREVFGPILHIVRFGQDRLEDVVSALNATGYGLTLGLHTRLDETIETVERLARVGNLYVNRNQIGAVIGVQPFGGEGLSGTGPKAGGPHYLHRFASERTLSIDTTASGGNASLLSLREE